MLNWAYLSGHVPDSQDFHETGTQKGQQKKFRRSKFEVESMGVDAVALFQGEMKSNSVRYTP